MATDSRGRTDARSAGGSGTMPAPVTLDDLTADLIWPRLLRAGALALNPARLGIAFFTVVALMSVLSIVRSIAGPDVDFLGPRWAAAGGMFDAVLRRDGDTAGTWLYDSFIAAPLALLRAAPVATLLGAVLALVVSAIAGGAICRMTACEFSLGMNIPWPQGIGFGVRRLPSLLGAVLGPVAIVWVLAALVALGGVLLRVPGLNVLAGLLFVLTLLIGLAAALLMGAYVLAKPLLIPAVACEGADAIDAVQRSYAYVFARPLRLIMYGAILLLEGALMIFVVRALASAADDLALRASAALAGEHGRTALDRAQAPERTLDGETWATARAAAWFIRLWLGALYALVAAYGLSFYFCASTLLYLAIRRVADGQDMNELWLGGPAAGPAPAVAPAGAAAETRELD